MTSPVPPSLKPITPYVLRARELFRNGAANTEIVAYHCYRYAIQLGIKLPGAKDPSAQEFLGELMTELESRRPHIAGKSETELEQICEEFANSVFSRADAIDLAGNADRATAQSFYAAATFLELLKQFSSTNELDPELKNRVLYAKWKATEIVKALKEGRKPTPGGVMGGDDHEQESEDTHHHPPPAKEEDIPIAHPTTTTTTTTTTARVTLKTAGRAVSVLSKPKKQDALEYARFATAAINAEDYPLAVQRLQDCLSLLCEE